MAQQQPMTEEQQQTYEAARRMFDIAVEQLTHLADQLAQGCEAPQVAEEENALPPEGTNPEAATYSGFPIEEVEIHPVDTALLMFVEMNSGMQRDCLRLLLIRDASSLRRELSRYRFFQFSWGGRPSPYQVEQMVTDGRALRRGQFMMAIYYRKAFYCVQCGHRTVKFDQHGFCVVCVYVFIRDVAKDRQPCHLLRDTSGALICRNCAAMPVDAYNKRYTEYEEVIKVRKRERLVYLYETVLRRGLLEQRRGDEGAAEWFSKHEQLVNCESKSYF